MAQSEVAALPAPYFETERAFFSRDDVNFLHFTVQKSSSLNSNAATTDELFCANDAFDHLTFHSSLLAFRW
eukprot:6178893-Pleurochrysis_carterae.AAC.1